VFTTFSYVLLLVTATSVAALGGYQIGSRVGSTPDADIATDKQVAVQAALERGRKAQRKADRVKLEKMFARATAWQRERDDARFEKRLVEQHIADGRMAARAYARGQVSGKRAAAERFAQQQAAAEKAAAAKGADAAAAAAGADGTVAPDGAAAGDAAAGTDPAAADATAP
jgi:hypothetical protein